MSPDRLDLFSAGSDPLRPETAARWLSALLILGIAARGIRFALRFPLWYDEAALSASFLDRGYLGMFQPLECGQVAPILFLWVQLTFVKLLGFNEYVLRLFPLLTGLGSLFLFRRLVTRLFSGTTAVIVFGTLAAAYPAIRYSTEGKPYGVDLFVSLGLIVLTVEWLQRPELRGWLWALVAAMPLAVGLSFTAVFTGGAVSLVIAWTLWKERGSRRNWVLWIGLNLLLVGSFLGSLAISQANTTGHSVEGLQLYWREAFPPLASLPAFGKWLLATHTGDLLAYPIGGKNGASTASFLACLAAVVFLVRRRQFRLLAILLVPALLNFLAAVLHRYPYGGHSRLAMHLGPAICLLSGVGLSAGIAWLTARQRGSRRPALVALALLALLPVGSAMRDIAQPARTDNDLRFRDFARWFWVSKSFDAELVCLKTDLGQGVRLPMCIEGDEAMYFCNQRIYSPRHSRGEAAPLDRVSGEHPLRCVRFLPAALPPDDAGFQRWLAEMESRYQLIGRETHHFPLLQDRRPDPLYVNTLEVYEFVPKPAAIAGLPPDSSYCK